MSLSSSLRPETRLGVLAVDPLRAIGLDAILEDVLRCTIVRLDPEHLDVSSRERNLSLLVMDASVGGDRPAALVAQVCGLYPMVPIVVLGGELPAARLREIYLAGARGYLRNTAAEGEIQECIVAVLAGETWPLHSELDGAEEELDDAAIEEEGPRRVRLRGRLTPRECEVLDLLKDGRSNREIAASMRIDEATVKAHLGRMLRKAGCTNRVELTLRALEERGSLHSV